MTYGQKAVIVLLFLAGIAAGGPSVYVRGGMMVRGLATTVPVALTLFLLVCGLYLATGGSRHQVPIRPYWVSTMTGIMIGLLAALGKLFFEAQL